MLRESVIHPSWLQFRCTEDLREDVRKAAAADRRTVSSWLRALVLDELAKLRPAPATEAKRRVLPVPVRTRRR